MPISVEDLNLPLRGAPGWDVPFKAAIVELVDLYNAQEQATLDAIDIISGAVDTSDAAVAATVSSGVATSSVLDRIYGRGVSITDPAFGAAGDGVADDTAEIQAAIDAVEAAGGGLVFFPRGTYRITSSLKLPSQVTLHGENGGGQVGTPSKVLWAGASGGKLVEPKNRTGNTINWNISGIEFDGAYTAAIILDFYRVSYSRVQDVLAHRTNSSVGSVAVLLDGNVAGQCYFNVFDNVKLSEAPTLARFQNGANTNRWMGGKIGNGGTGMEFLSLSAGNAIIAVDFEDNTVRHVYLDASSNKFIGCHMEAAPLGYEITANAPDNRRFGTSLATNVTTWVTDASIDANTLDRFSPTTSVKRLGRLIELVTSLGSGTTVESDPVTVSPGNSIWRMFRNVTTTGIRQFVIHRGNGTSEIALQVNAGDQNVQLADMSAHGGLRVIAVRDRVAAPTSTPSAGGVLYSESGTLRWNSSGGSKVTVGGDTVAYSSSSAVPTGTRVALGTAGAGGITLTLGTAVGNKGLTHTVKKVDAGAGAVTVATTSSQTIDGVTTRSLPAQYDRVTVVSDGANWMVV